MNTTSLETFLVLSKVLNFTKTSEFLFVAQSTVTNRIAELEKELGQPLFIRNSRNLKLTEAGKKFTDYATRILALEEAAVTSLNQELPYKESLHLGTTNTIFECHLKSSLVSYLKQHDSIKTKVTIGHSLELLQMLQDDLIDCAFTYIPLKKMGFTCECFRKDELVLVCSYDDLTYESGILKAELPRLNYLYCNFALQDVGIFIRQLFPENYQFSFEIDNSTKLLDFVLDGLGCSFLPYSLVRQKLEEKYLRIIPLLDFDSPQINNYKIYRQERKIPFCL